MSSRLRSKISRIEKASGGRRYARESLESDAAKCAFGFIENLIDVDVPGLDISPERRVAARLHCDRVIRADIALASGNAAGLATVHRNVLEEYVEWLDNLSRSFVMVALSSDGLADWDSDKREWVGPGCGDPTGESEFETTRRWQRATEALREWCSNPEGLLKCYAKVKAAHELTEQKRSESAEGARWANFERKLDVLRVRYEADDDDDE